MSLLLVPAVSTTKRIRVEEMEAVVSIYYMVTIDCHNVGLFCKQNTFFANKSKEIIP